jgi:hypothetical protein
VAGAGFPLGGGGTQEGEGVSALAVASRSTPPARSGQPIKCLALSPASTARRSLNRACLTGSCSPVQPTRPTPRAAHLTEARQQLRDGAGLPLALAQRGLDAALVERRRDAPPGGDAGRL